MEYAIEKPSNKLLAATELDFDISCGRRDSEIKTRKSKIKNSSEPHIPAPLLHLITNPLGHLIRQFCRPAGDKSGEEAAAAWTVDSIFPLTGSKLRSLIIELHEILPCFAKIRGSFERIYEE